VVGMANFSPVVNTVGAIFTHEDGIVTRPTYHIFDLYTNHTYEEIVHSALASPSFDVLADGGSCKSVQQLDAVVTRDPTTGNMGITLVNLHGENTIQCRIRGLGRRDLSGATIRTVNGASVDAFNDVDQPEAVSIEERTLVIDSFGDFTIECPAHSVSVLNLV